MLSLASFTAPQSAALHVMKICLLLMTPITTLTMKSARPWPQSQGKHADVERVQASELVACLENLLLVFYRHLAGVPHGQLGKHAGEG